MPIFSVEDYERAMAELTSLMERSPEAPRGSPEAERLTALATEIEAYEKERFPFLPVHPGAMVSEYLESRAWTEADLADRTGLTAEEVANLCAGQCSITPLVAAHLARVFDRPESFWINLQNQFTRATIERVKRAAEKRRAEPIAVGDVIQIHPGHHSLGGALAFVTELHRWGLVAEVPVPGRGVAPVRLGETEFLRIGRAGYPEARS